LRIEGSFMKPDSGHRTEVSVFYFPLPSDVELIHI
jgi:hypothetical protein